jgi:hypothetical protein
MPQIGVNTWAWVSPPTTEAFGRPAPKVARMEFDLIRDIGFSGPMVIELFTSQVKTIARAPAIRRSFAESQDALAENGLRFLRALTAVPAKASV